MAANEQDTGAGGSIPPELAEAWTRAEPRLGPMAHRVRWFHELASTNDEALRLATSGAEEGWLVGADAQTSGRGRHGRTWASPHAAGLYLSLILRPAAHAVPLLTLAAGLGVAEGIERATGVAARVKWPNDVYLSSVTPRKVAGILAESGVSGGRVEFVVLGMGVNVRSVPWPMELAARATSLEEELGRDVDRGLVAAEVCASVWQRYAELQEGQGGDIHAAWRARSVDTFGRRVEWDADGRTCQGVARDVDASGALLVEQVDGTTRVTAGEVRWTS